jgi:hypothetical protein
VARTQATLDALVAELQGNCGDLFAACQRTGVSLIFVRTWMKDDKEVAAQLVEAERVGAMGLQSEAIRRATVGEEKGVYFKGERVGTEYVKSDGLLQTLLKGRLPDIFGKDSEGLGGITANGNVQINIMPRAANYDEWLTMKESTLALRSRNEAAAALPAPVTIDVTPVNAFEGLGI